MTRYYDPKTGRFINADSIEYLNPNAINGLSLYAYCGNNPVMYTDDSGNAGAIIWLSVAMILSGAVIGAIAGVLANHNLGSNIDAKPSTPSPVNPSINTNDSMEFEDNSLTFGDRMLNMGKGALLGTWVGSMATMVAGVGVALLGAATGAGIVIAGGIGTFAFGQATALLISPLLFALGIQVNTPDEDPTQKYETGLPQIK